MTCTLTDPHDCATVRAANAALRRHLDKACNERDALRAACRHAFDGLNGPLDETVCRTVRAWLARALGSELDTLSEGG